MMMTSYMATTSFSAPLALSHPSKQRPARMRGRHEVPSIHGPLVGSVRRAISPSLLDRASPRYVSLAAAAVLVLPRGRSGEVRPGGHVRPSSVAQSRSDRCTYTYMDADQRGGRRPIAPKRPRGGA